MKCFARQQSFVLVSTTMYTNGSNDAIARHLVGCESTTVSGAVVRIIEANVDGCSVSGKMHVSRRAFGRIVKFDGFVYAVGALHSRLLTTCPITNADRSFFLSRPSARRTSHADGNAARASNPNTIRQSRRRSRLLVRRSNPSKLKCALLQTFEECASSGNCFFKRV